MFGCCFFSVVDECDVVLNLLTAAQNTCKQSRLMRKRGGAVAADRSLYFKPNGIRAALVICEQNFDLLYAEGPLQTLLLVSM